MAATKPKAPRRELAILLIVKPEAGWELPLTKASRKKKKKKAAGRKAKS